MQRAGTRAGTRADCRPTATARSSAAGRAYPCSDGYGFNHVPLAHALALDLAFRDASGWTVIDWKTGAEPSAANERAVVMQLAAYRIAWAELMAARQSRLTGRPVEPPLDMVRAAFHYVRTGRTIAPEDLPDADRLARLITTAGAEETPAD